MAKIRPSEGWGCSKSAVTPLRMVQSSCRLGYWSPGASTSKLWWFCSCRYLQFLSGKLESRRYVSAKVGENSALRGGFSVVFDGPVEVEYVQNCSYKCSVTLEIVQCSK